MAVANSYLQNEWEEWKRQIEDNRRRSWGEGVSRWAEEEASDETEEKKHNGEEKDCNDNEKAEVNEEEDENEAGAKVEEWEEEIEEDKENEEEREGENKAIEKKKKGDEVVIDTDGKVENEVEGKGKEKENQERVMKEPQELDEGEEEAEKEVQWELMGSEEVAEEEQGKMQEANRFNEKKEGQNEDEMEGNLNGEIGGEEEKEVLEEEEMQEEQDKGKHEVEREVKDAKEENEVWEDEQVKEEDDGEEEHLAEQFAEQIKRTEDDNENPESKAHDNRVEDFVESMNTEDSDSVICEGICYNSERINDEEQYVETQTVQNLDEQLGQTGNPILGAWTLQERNEGGDSEKTDEEETVAEFWETQEEDVQDDHKGFQDEESTDDEEAEHSMDDEDGDDENVKIYSKDNFPTDLFHTLTQFKDLLLLTDLTLSTKEGTNFHVHSPVLAAVSSLIWEHLSKKDNASVGVHRWSVSLDPPVDYVGLQAVVEFAYTGTISCLNKDTVEQIRPAAQTLGIPRVLMLCNEEEEKSTKTSGGLKKGERISAAEQMMLSLRSIKQLWMDRVGCDVILEGLGESLHGELITVYTV